MVRKFLESTKKKNRRMSVMLGIGTTSLILSMILQATARLIPGFAEWYALHIYPVIVGVLGRICGIAPFSVVELGLYLLIVSMLWNLVRHIREWKRLAVMLYALVGSLLFLYTANCGINYYRTPFSSYLDLDIRESSVEELEELCRKLVIRVNEAEQEWVNSSVWREDGYYSYQDQKQLANLGREAMEQLGKHYEQLSGFYPIPKPVGISWILSVQQLSGVYSPFTVEANYNWQMTGYNIPHTICHELSHLKGFMREDEANFIGYLACMDSEDPFFRYSAYLTGWVYAGNALAKQNLERFAELRGQLCPRAIADMQENNRYWDQYEGEIAEAANQVNDTYLKINSQKDGIKSYGRMVDLMLAYERAGQPD